VTIEHLLSLQDVAGAQVVDTREAPQFASGHLRGSINIGLVGQYATWAGTVLDREKPIVLIADPGQEGESAMRLGRIGLDMVVGYLDGGFRSVDARPDLIARTERLTPELAVERLASSAAPVLVDVRAPGERAKKRIDGSVSMPLQEMGERLQELPRDRPILVYCAGGYRSSLAASVLQRAGFTNVSEIAGGIASWEAAALPLAS
jgi:rhodanese-related sulfurtransferase